MLKRIYSLTKKNIVVTVLMALIMCLGLSSAAWADNSWQIENPGGTVTSDDACVRIHKTVAPTATENEFQITVSIDKVMAASNYFDSSGFVITTSNKYGGNNVGDVITGGIVGNNTVVGTATDTGGSREYYVTINLYDNETDKNLLVSYDSTRHGNTPNCQNGTVFLTLPTGEKVIISKSCSLSKTAVPTLLTIDVYRDQIDLSGLFDVSFSSDTTTGVADAFTDVMGPDVEVVSIDSYDGAAPTVSGNTITWVPVEQTVTPEYQTSSPFGAWYNGVAHMTYTVRLDPTRSNGIPTSDPLGDIFPTNDTASTVLSYHKETVSTTPVVSPGAVNPVSPEVRALLYDIELKKVDEQGNGLSGAVFTLCDENGDSLGITATSKDDGTAKFHNLQYGTYKVKETQAPSGYTADTTEAGPYNLCWTSNSGSLTQDHASGHDADEADDVKNAILPGDMDEIVNKRAVTLVVHKTDNASPAQPLEGVYFELSGDTVYSDAACTTPAGALPTDEDGNVTFYGLKPGTYYLEETAALPGYEPLTEAVKVEVTVESNNLHIYFYEGDKRFEGVLDDSYTATFSLVNTPMPNLLVVKMDSSGKPLAGAEFSLSKSGATPQDETTAIDANVTQVGSYSCDTGLAVARFDSIASGEYTFEETRVPAGYQRGEGSYTVKAEGGKLYIKEGAGSYTECNTGVLDGKTYYYVGVENDGVPVLPVTGVEVPVLAGVCGFVILIAGVSGLLTYDALSQGMPSFLKPHSRGKHARA